MGATDFVVINIIIALVLLVVFVLYDILIRRKTVQQVDATIVERLAAFEQREKMLLLENEYQKLPDNRKRLIEIAVMLLRVTDPLLKSVRSDEALIKLLEDIQQPGEPVDVPVVEPVVEPEVKVENG